MTDDETSTTPITVRLASDILAAGGYASVQPLRCDWADRCSSAAEWHIIAEEARGIGRGYFSCNRHLALSCRTAQESVVQRPQSSESAG